MTVLTILFFKLFNEFLVFSNCFGDKKTPFQMDMQINSWFFSYCGGLSFQSNPIFKSYCQRHNGLICWFLSSKELLSNHSTIWTNISFLSKLHIKDDNSKLVEVVTVVEVDDEKRVDNCLVQIWKFGHTVKFLFRLWGQGFKVWSRFWNWCSGKILKLKFGHHFAADGWLWLWSSFLVEILVLFGQDL